MSKGYMKELYDLKTPSYFSSARREILPALPQFSERVLEIGCGTGATLGWLKEIGRCKETFGVELVEEASQIAETVVDRVILADIEEETIDLPEQYFNLILCLDVLEHMKNPWRILRMLVQRWLVPGGIIIVSIPNLRYRKVLIDLLIHSLFEYQDAGILDRTHLRFFTKHSAISLLRSSGLENVRLDFHPSDVKGKAAVLNAITFGFFRDTFSWQLVLTGRKPFEQN